MGEGRDQSRKHPASLGTHKNVDAVVMCAERSGLASRVARLTPVLCIKG
jgi:RNA-splicing ligase RtcB